MIPITIKTGSSTGVLASTLVFSYGAYTLSYAPSAAALPAPAFAPATSSSSVTITMSNLALTTALSIDTSSSLKFEYDPR